MENVDLVAESLVALAQISGGEDEQSSSHRAVSEPTPIPSMTLKESIALRVGQDCSPTGVVDLFTLMMRDKQRARLNSVASSSDLELGEINNLNLDGPGTAAPAATEAPVKFIGTYSPSARKRRIERFLEKRKRRVWAKKVDYGVRKNFADSRLRVKGRFVKKEDEERLVKLLGFT